MGKGKGKESNPTNASADTLFVNEILVPRSSSFFFFFLSYGYLTKEVSMSANTDLRILRCPYRKNIEHVHLILSNDK